MPLFGRRDAVPAEVRRAVPGAVLAAARAEDGAWLVGTRDAFHAVRDSDAVESWRWEEVHRADWDSDTSTLRVERVVDYGEPVTSLKFVVPEAGSLLTLVRERVTASVVVERRVRIRGKRGLTVIGRRAPSASGEVTWAYELDPGVEAGDPAVTAAAEQALREAQESLGL